jgi:hypothetical protein
MECPICVSITKEKNFIRCFSCKQEYCTKCVKTYLLQTTTEEPHCMNCRQVIDYHIFIDKFDKTWRLGEYKKHKEKILWEKEQAHFPSTVGYIELVKKRDEISKLQREYHDKYNYYSFKLRRTNAFDDDNLKLYKQKKKHYYELAQKYNEELNEIFRQLQYNKEKKLKYQWTQACPEKECKGFLNEKYDCPLCSKHFCKDCLECVPQEEIKTHVCNEELKETMKMIRKESRPCPTCGEYISKVSGCDQMFCTECGTAFSWTTGLKEMGVIHNPHAHTFFQQNPNALQDYMNHRNGGGGVGQGECREQVPNYNHQQRLIKNMLHSSWNELEINMFYQQCENIEHVRRNLAEYNIYSRQRYARLIHENGDNLELRVRFLKNEMDEKKFKTILHMRTKKNQFQKLIHELIISTVTIVTGLLWSMLEVRALHDFLKITEMMFDLRTSTNEMIQKLKEKHNYTEQIVIGEFFEIPRYI